MQAGAGQLNADRARRRLFFSSFATPATARQLDTRAADVSGTRNGSLITSTDSAVEGWTAAGIVPTGGAIGDIQVPWSTQQDVRT